MVVHTITLGGGRWSCDCGASGGCYGEVNQETLYELSNLHIPRMATVEEWLQWKNGYRTVEDVEYRVEDDQSYAFFKWQSRWNKAEQVAALSQVGSRIFFTTAMGVVILDLENGEDIAAYISQMSGALNLLKKTKEDYDNAARSS